MVSGSRQIPERGGAAGEVRQVGWVQEASLLNIKLGVNLRR